MEGEEKGLSRSGVKGAVRGLCSVPTEERRNTEPGVFRMWLGIGVFGRSVAPDDTVSQSRVQGIGSQSSCFYLQGLHANLFIVNISTLILWMLH